MTEPAAFRTLASPRRAVAAAVACAAVLWASAPRALATEDETPGGPPPKTAAESKAPIEKVFVPPAETATVLPGPNEWFKVQPSFLRDMKVHLNVRSYYLMKDKFDDTYNEAWALGGYLSVKSGYICDRVAFGVTGYGSLPLYAPDDRDGTLLLKPDQEGYAVLGELYGEVKLGRGVMLDVGRKEYNTPYINKNDNRMTPNTFEALTVVGKHGGKDGCPSIVWGGGYFTRIKERNSDEFVPMSEDAGVDSVNHGVGVAAGRYSAKTWSIGLAEYYCEDVLNILYAEGTWQARTRGKLGLKFAGQFTDQRSTGDNLLTGSAFDTQQFGLKADASYGAVLGTLAFTSTADGSDMRNPWSSCPGYTSVQVQDFNRAGEEAFLAKASLDLCKAIGIPGTTVYALWVHGWDRTAGPNEDEIDLDAQWRPSRKSLEGLSVRVRYAYVEQRDGSNDTLDDFRIIVNYDIDLR